MKGVFSLIVLDILFVVIILAAIVYGAAWVFENVDLAHELGDFFRRFEEAREGKQ